MLGVCSLIVQGTCMKHCSYLFLCIVVRQWHGWRCLGFGLCRWTTECADKGVVWSDEGSGQKNWYRCYPKVWSSGDSVCWGVCRYSIIRSAMEEVDWFREGLFKKNKFECQADKGNDVWWKRMVGVGLVRGIAWGMNPGPWQDPQLWVIRVIWSLWGMEVYMWPSVQLKRH